MLLPVIPWLLPLLLTIFPPTTAVAVTMTLTDYTHTEVLQICSDLPPGMCCRSVPVPHLIFAEVTDYNPVRTTFSGLAPLDIAAIWGPRGTIGGCSGTPIRTWVGPGQWTYGPWVTEVQASGASYVRMPTSLPPGEEEADWLGAEGFLGLVWGGGRWFAKGAGVGLMSLVPRGVMRGAKGRAYIQAPGRGRRPDVLVVDGTRYVDAGAGGAELRYESRDGRVLNMTG